MTPTDLIVVDTETQGLDPAVARIVEVAIVRGDGRILLDTLINPLSPIPADASAIHGIKDADVAGAPTLSELMPALSALLRGKRVVIYNRAFDVGFFPRAFDQATAVHCCMLRAQNAMRQSRWPKLTAAATWANYSWVGKPHSAAGDCLATLAVWKKLDELGTPVL